MGSLVSTASSSIMNSAFNSLVSSVFGGSNKNKSTDFTTNTTSDRTLSVSTYGKMIPIVYSGRIGTNLIWAKATRVRRVYSSVGNSFDTSDPNTTLARIYNYMNLAFALCEGPISGLLKIWMEGTLVWDAFDQENSQIDPQLYLGSADQDPCPLMIADLGEDNVPAYRGLCYFTLEDFNITPYGSRIPNVSVSLVGKLPSLWGQKGAQGLTTDNTNIYLVSHLQRTITKTDNTLKTLAVLGDKVTYQNDYYYSNDLSNLLWVKNNINVTQQDTIKIPNIDISPWLITVNNTNNNNNYLYQEVICVVNQISNFYIYAKSQGYNYLHIDGSQITGNTDWVNINLANGSIGNSNLNNAEVIVEQQSDNFYRISFIAKPTVVNTKIIYSFYDNDYNSQNQQFAGNNINGVLVGGFQVVKNKTPLNYVENIDSLKLVEYDKYLGNLDAHPWRITYDFINNCIWSISFCNDTLQKINPLTGDIISELVLDIYPYEIILDANNNLWITHPIINKITQINTSNLSKTVYSVNGEISVLALNPNNGNLYGTGINEIVEIDTNDGSVVSRTTLADGVYFPHGIAWNVSDNRFWIALSGNDTLAIFNPADKSISYRNTGTFPFYVATNPNDPKYNIYVSTFFGNRVKILKRGNNNSLTELTEFKTEVWPGPMLALPSGKVIVSNTNRSFAQEILGAS